MSTAYAAFVLVMQVQILSTGKTQLAGVPFKSLTVCESILKPEKYQEFYGKLLKSGYMITDVAGCVKESTWKEALKDAKIRKEKID